MHAVEDRMWWYRGLRALAGQLLRRALPQAASDGPASDGPASDGPACVGPVLDAGCGTGGMLRALGASVSGCPTLGLEHDATAATLAAAKAVRAVAVGSVNEMPFGNSTLGAYVS